MDWQPIETAPRDDRFIAAIEVHSTVTKKHWWQMDIVWCDEETGELHPDCDFGWGLSDYSHWMPLPAPPVT